jgi:hypothetical protein
MLRAAPRKNAANFVVPWFKTVFYNLCMLLFIEKIKLPAKTRVK